MALTMGPPQAREALVHCLALGADRGVHLVDPAFAGSDTLATARALALALRREGFDLVLCGKSSVDAETGQVGPEIAELLDLPQVTAVRRLDLDASRGRVKAERETDAGFETVECQLPALVSVTEDIAAERFPKRAEKEAAKAKPITELAARDLSEDRRIFGVAGSPTRVEGLQSVEVKREARLCEGDSPKAVRSVVAALAERGVFRPRAMRNAAAPLRERPRGPRIPRDRSGWSPRCSTGGCGASASSFSARPSRFPRKAAARVSALLLGHGVRAHARELAAHGAESILVCDDPLLADYSTDAYAAVLAEAIRDTPAALGARALDRVRPGLSPLASPPGSVSA